MTSPDPAPDSAPAPRRSSGDDPGLLRSLSSGQPLGQIRTAGLVFCALPVVIGALLPFVLDDAGADPAIGPGLSVLVVAAVAVGGLATQVRLVPRQYPPFELGVSERDAAREAALRLRSAMFLRLALSESGILAGFVMSIVSGSAWPYVVGFVLGWPFMLLSVPTTAHIERARERMESAGAHVPVWEALLPR